MWSEGVIGIPDAKDKKKHTKCHYWVKHYDEPSETYGINGGRISKLMIKIDGETVCNYDRGWDIHPTCKEAEMALCIPEDRRAEYRALYGQERPGDRKHNRGHPYLP